MASIDPYGLLGATVSSTVAEVKQAYYALSLIVHPDKGGSAADMIVVHNAYKYVRAQLSEVNRSVTVEDLEARFAAFCEAQNTPPPTFVEVRRASCMRQFHTAFESQPRDGVLSASMSGGYGQFMAASDNHEVEGAEGAEAVAVPFQTEIVTYVEPETSATDTRLCFTETERGDDPEDYGTLRPFQMTDYRVAYSTTREALPEVSELIMRRTFEDLVGQRQSVLG